MTVETAGTSGTGRALDTDTLFETGSVTKTFTATLLATMVLDGSVKLTDPVQNYLPASVHVPAYHGKPITLLDLATQHSGLPRLPGNLDGGRIQPYASYTVKMMYDFLNSYHLERAPGAMFEYSNYGIALLGQALANRARLPYPELLRKRVLDPLGMRNTFLEMTGAGPGVAKRILFARGATIDGDPAPTWSFDAIAPAGALVSSINDMLKYARCNMGTGPLAKACLLAQEPRAEFPGNRIGLVWWTSNASRIVHHGGDTAGYHASVAVSPDRKSAVVVLANGGLPVDDLALRALDPSQSVAHAPEIVPIPGVNLDDYVGTYTATEPELLTFTIENRDGRFMAKLQNQAFYRAYPTARDVFKYRVVDATLAFTRTDDGRVNAVQLFQDGTQILFVKSGMPAPKSTPDPFPSVIPLDAKQLQEYVGTYNAEGLTFVVTLEDRQLMVRLSGQNAYPVYPSAPDTFYYKVVSAELTFGRNSAGTITGLILHQNGRDVPAKRILGLARALPVFAIDRVDVVFERHVQRRAGALHPVALCDRDRSRILGADQGDHARDVEVIEGPVTASTGRFGRIAAAPIRAGKNVADLDLVGSVHELHE